MTNEIITTVMNTVKTRAQAMAIIYKDMNQVQDSYLNGYSIASFVRSFEWYGGYDLWEQMINSLPFVAYIDICDGYDNDSNAFEYTVYFMEHGLFHKLNPYFSAE